MALTGAILPPSTRWAVSGDMRTCVIVMTEVLLALRRGGWVCCSPPPSVGDAPPRQWSGWNVHSAEGQTRSGARPGRLADKGDEEHVGWAWCEQGRMTQHTAPPIVSQPPGAGVRPQGALKDSGMDTQRSPLHAWGQRSTATPPLKFMLGPGAPKTEHSALTKFQAPQSPAHLEKPVPPGLDVVRLFSESQGNETSPQQGFRDSVFRG